MPSGEKFWLLTTTTLESMTKPLLCTFGCKPMFAVRSTPASFIFSAQVSPYSRLSMSRTSTPADSRGNRLEQGGVETRRRGFFDVLQLHVQRLFCARNEFDHVSDVLPLGSRRQRVGGQQRRNIDANIGEGLCGHGSGRRRGGWRRRRTCFRGKLRGGIGYRLGQRRAFGNLVRLRGFEVLIQIRLEQIRQRLIFDDQ